MRLAALKILTRRLSTNRSVRLLAALPKMDFFILPHNDTNQANEDRRVFGSMKKSNKVFGPTTVYSI